ncbi:pyruvate dehydrogenase complex transcriptional repressor PdhR [Psychromonas ossibalaenae]|uniref:pyruvate dehydrogenase complex transcriptional repressor PdhR n=1 Tax=Psychromonas ossibalaenae TaxID=444922 RepID=UPI000367D384|nr:pyruvate dehydrogenase complex transcriptional repressor PdhR [Psychromonas ossibalaenae]
MSYAKIKQPKLADVIENRLESMILEGTLELGEKLPPERELAKQFDVSRPSLREAIQRLESKGLLTRRQGGGTYVKEELREQLTDPLFELLNTHPESQYDLLEFRHALEGVSAYYAALRGTAEDFCAIKNSFEAIEKAQQADDLELEIQNVALFYLSVIEASHNVVFLHLARGIKPLLEKNISDNVKQLYSYPEVAKKIHQHRVQLLDAILSKQPKKAQEASAKHLIYIEETRLVMLREESLFKRELGRF